MMLINFKKTSRILPVEKMLEGELWISKQIESGVGLDGNLLDVCSQLKLRIIKKNLPSKIDATLRPSLSPDYLGVIEINKDIDCEQNKFAMIHELVHYLYDVGAGNKVTKKYSRSTRGEPKNDTEQYVDYISAAIRMPWQSVTEDIREFRDSYPGIDELAFIAEHGKKYGENITIALKSSYFRRIKEVILLNNHVQQLTNGIVQDANVVPITPPPLSAFVAMVHQKSNYCGRLVSIILDFIKTAFEDTLNVAKLLKDNLNNIDR